MENHGSQCRSNLGVLPYVSPKNSLCQEMSFQGFHSYPRKIGRNNGVRMVLELSFVMILWFLWTYVCVDSGMSFLNFDQVASRLWSVWDLSCLYWAQAFLTGHLTLYTKVKQNCFQTMLTKYSYGKKSSFCQQPLF